MPITPSLLLTLGLLSALTPFAIDMYLPSIPAIARDLDAPVALVQLSVTVYIGVFAAAQLLLGPLSDVLGRRLPVAAGLMVFALADVACALAPLPWRRLCSVSCFADARKAGHDPPLS